MKKIILGLALTSMTLSSLAFAPAAEALSERARAVKQTRNLRKACPNVLQVGGQSSTIYKNSAPLRSGGIGTPIVGFRREPTLIMNRRFTTSGTSIFDSAGTRIGGCPWASAHGHAGGRFRCTMQTGSLRGAAVRNTRKANVFFKVNGSTCVEVPDAGRCYGSVKGLCNQLIR